jgi:phage anti-repressor protein
MMSFHLYFELQQFLHDHDQKNPYNNKRIKSSAFIDSNKFIVPDEFDRTPDNPEAWDQRILDVDIARLMRMIMKEPPGRSFAQENPDIANIFFSAPYHAIPRQEFGYI